LSALIGFLSLLLLFSLYQSRVARHVLLLAMDVSFSALKLDSAIVQPRVCGSCLGITALILSVLF